MTERVQNKNLNPWKKGQSGNPAGRPRSREDLKKVKLVSQVDVKRMIQRIMDMNVLELQAYLADPETPSMEKMIAQIVDKAVNQGDQARMNFLLERTIGKVVEEKNVNIRPVRYVTQVNPGDGTLIQEVIEQAAQEIEAEILSEREGPDRTD